jgi:predicted GIY-YIG superfamily endonuclease
MSEKQYFVYIMAGVTKTLYIGVTSNLPARIYQHKNDLIESKNPDWNDLSEEF